MKKFVKFKRNDKDISLYEIKNVEVLKELKEFLEKNKKLVLLNYKNGYSVSFNSSVSKKYKLKMFTDDKGVDNLLERVSYRINKANE